MPLARILPVVSMMLCGISFGQSPKILAIVSATFNQRVAENGIGTIFGSNLAAGIFSSGTPVAQLGSTQVLLCGTGIASQNCQSLGLYFVGPSQINFFIPPNLSEVVTPAELLETGVRLNLVGTGPWNIALSVNGVLDADASSGTYFKMPIYQQAPDFFVVESDRFMDTTVPSGFFPIPPTTVQRGALVDLSGRVIDASNPAHLGQYYSIYMTGLGKVDANGHFASSGTFPAGGGSQVWINGYVIPWASQATVTFQGISPQYPGLDQINFRMPGSIGHVPCGDQIIEPFLGVSPAGTEKQVHFPLAIANGEVPCTP